MNGKNNAGVLPSTSINSQKVWQHRQQSSFSRGGCSDFLVQFMADAVLLEPTMPGRHAGQVGQERLWSRFPPREEAVRIHQGKGVFRREGERLVANKDMTPFPS